MPLENDRFIDYLQPDYYTDEEGRPDRVLALEVADALTPEDAQKLYRFVILVTKLCVPAVKGL